MKKVILAMMALGFAQASQAAYLCWQVTSETGDLWAHEFEGAQVHVITTGEKGGSGDQVAAVYNAAGESFGTAVAVVNKEMTDPAYVNLSDFGGDYTGYSYYIELVNWNSASSLFETVATSAVESYAALSGSVSDTLSSISPVTLSAWHGSGVPAPEPTSALLMALGLAGLALRRRAV